jgi:hypothetical protein
MKTPNTKKGSGKMHVREKSKISSKKQGAVFKRVNTASLKTGVGLPNLKKIRQVMAGDMGRHLAKQNKIAITVAARKEKVVSSIINNIHNPEPEVDEETKGGASH